MTEIEELKAQIKVLEKKLSFLEELEKTKSPCEKAFKEFYGAYPITDIADTSWDSDGWVYFEAGYNAAQKDYKVGEFQEQEEQKWDAVRESVKWCEEHPDKDPLDWVKPQTPEQVADGLKEAFREAVKQGVVSSTNPDEIVLEDAKMFHLESMNERTLWVGVYTQNGKTYHLNISADGTISYQ